MSYTISQIHDAIVDELKGSATLASLCKTIDSYHGEIDDLISQVAQLMVPMPAVYVLYDGTNYEEVANRSYDKALSFTIIAITKDLRGNEKLKAAMIPILDELETVLIDNNLDLDIEPLHPQRIEASLITKLFSIYSFDLKTSFSL